MYNLLYIYNSFWHRTESAESCAHIFFLLFFKNFNLKIFIADGFFLIRLYDIFMNLNPNRENQFFRHTHGKIYNKKSRTKNKFVNAHSYTYLYLTAGLVFFS